MKCEKIVNDICNSLYICLHGIHNSFPAVSLFCLQYLSRRAKQRVILCTPINLVQWKIALCAHNRFYAYYFATVEELKCDLASLNESKVLMLMIRRLAGDVSGWVKLPDPAWWSFSHRNCPRDEINHKACCLKYIGKQIQVKYSDPILRAIV